MNYKTGLEVDTQTWLLNVSVVQHTSFTRKGDDVVLITNDQLPVQFLTSFGLIFFLGPDYLLIQITGLLPLNWDLQG